MENTNCLYTRYGTLEGCREIVAGPSGNPESLFLTEWNQINIPLWPGSDIIGLEPLFHVEDAGRRRETPLLFHSDGVLRSLPLQKRVSLKTSVGIIPAELLAFHKDGSVRRIFPSAGKLSGFWTEEHEYEQAPVCEFELQGIPYKARLISAGFWPSGALQSLTLWPDERMVISTPLGDLEIRTGVSFFENGTVRSVEPAAPVRVPTPIGPMEAFDNDPVGISGDANSLCFDAEGRVESLTTLTSAVKVLPAEGDPQLFSAFKTQSFCEETDTSWKVLPVKFAPGQVRLGRNPAVEFPTESTIFEVVAHRAPIKLGGCSGH